MNFVGSINFVKRDKLAVFGLKLFFCTALLFGASAVLIVPGVRADNVGDRQTFLIDSSYDYSGRSEIEATLKRVSSNAYFYVEDDYYNNLSDSLKTEFDSFLSSLSESFDKVIYPKMRETFGEEWKPGVDNDDKITILFTKTKENIGGYFNPNDEYRKDEIIDGRSNEREMIYLNAIFAGNDRVKSFLAHEFQHMITWYHKTKLRGISEDIWLNEGRSEYASTAIGYDNNYPISNLRARVESFDPADSLMGWQNKIYDYSTVNLFSQYLADHFGKALFKTMIGNDKTGVESIESALRELGFDDSFEDIFTNWTVANYLNDKNISADKRYGYINPNLSYQNFHVHPTSSYAINDANTTIRLETSIKDWSVRYYEFRAQKNRYGESNTLEIDFDGENSGTFSVPYVVFYDNGTKEVDKLNLDSNQDSKSFIAGFGKNISSVLVAPSSQKRKNGSSNNMESYYFSLSVKMTKSVPLEYPNGSLLKASDGEKVYVIENGKKRWITSVAAFVSNGYKWEDVITVSPQEIAMFEDGENVLMPDGSLIKGSGPKVYLVENGKKRWITTAKVFVARGYKWEDIIEISDKELALYLDGENVLMPDGSLIKGSGPKVYLVENGKKRWITTAKVFVARGYKWEDIIEISDKELALYLDGESIR